MDSAPSQTGFDAISANLRMILRGLLVGLGAWRLEPVLGLATYRRITVIFDRIERMLVRFRAGKLRRRTPRASTAARVGRSTPAEAVPRRFGWLVQAAGSEAACYGSQLQVALNSAEMIGLLAASPQARRVLRPLCRALAVELPWVVDKARAETGARKPRRRKPRVKPEPFRIPLPRGVLAAARRQGFGKMC